MQDGQQEKQSKHDGKKKPWWAKKKQKQKAEAKPQHDANGNTVKTEPEVNGNVKKPHVKVSGNRKPERKAPDTKLPHHARQKAKNGEPTAPPVAKTKPYVPLADRLKEQFDRKPINQMAEKLLVVRIQSLKQRREDLLKIKRGTFRTDEALWMAEHFLKQAQESKLERFKAPPGPYKAPVVTLPVEESAMASIDVVANTTIGAAMSPEFAAALLADNEAMAILADTVVNPSDKEATDAHDESFALPAEPITDVEQKCEKIRNSSLSGAFAPSTRNSTDDVLPVAAIQDLKDFIEETTGQQPT